MMKSRIGVAVYLLPMMAFSCGGQTPDAKNPEAATETQQATETNAAADDGNSVDTVALCNAVEQSSDIPLGCTFQALDGEPTMVLRVPDETILASTIDQLVSHLVVPFCSSQNGAEQQSGVLFVVATRARRFDCATAQVGEWIDLAPQQRQAITIGQACEAISRSGAQVSCDLMDLDGVPSMVVGYDSHANVDDSVTSIVKGTAASFCQSAAEANVPASLVLLKDHSLAKAYDCSSGRSGDWFSVRQQRKPTQPNLAPPSRQSAPSRPGRMAMAGNGGWDLLRTPTQ